MPMYHCGVWLIVLLVFGVLCVLSAGALCLGGVVKLTCFSRFVIVFVFVMSDGSWVEPSLIQWRVETAFFLLLDDLLLLNDLLLLMVTTEGLSLVSRRTFLNSEKKVTSKQNNNGCQTEHITSTVLICFLSK